MSANTKYGFCRGECQKWVPRDEMLSINVSVYGADNEETRIPLRFCPACHKKIQEQIEQMRWDNVLRTEAEIMSDEDLAKASPLEFDERLSVVEDAATAMRRNVHVEKPRDVVSEPEMVARDVPLDDESEAAMRRMGKRVDVTY